MAYFETQTHQSSRTGQHPAAAAAVVVGAGAGAEVGRKHQNYSVQAVG